jgi:hypothetical protein
MRSGLSHRIRSGFVFACALSLALLAVAGCGDDDSSGPRPEPNMVLQLDGNGDYVSIPIANHAFATFTVEVKVKVADFDANIHYVSLYQNAYLVLGDWDSDCLSTWASGLSPVDACESANPTATGGEWHHLALSYDGTNQYVLVDGVVAGVVPTSGTLTNDDTAFNQGLKIGARYTGGTQYVSGQLDEVRVWNVYRTETQIRDNMNGPIAAQTGLVGYWNFDDATANDSSGNDAHGTLVGDASIVDE